MKNKKVMKVISFVTVLLMVMMMVMPVFADDNLTNPGLIQGQNSPAAGTVNNALNIILGVVQVVAVGVAVIMLIVLAIKYISASPEGKADIKKSAAQYVVGAILLFGATGILGIVRTFALNIAGNNTI